MQQLEQNTYLKELIIEKIIAADGREQTIGWHFYFNENGEQTDEQGNVLPSMFTEHDPASNMMKWGWLS